MCFSTGNRGKAKVAKRNIKVYKVITLDGWGLHYNLIINRKNTPWEIGMHYTETMFPRIWTNKRDNISKHAFHSSKVAPNIYSYDGYYNLKVGLFIIPKGSLYYENTKNRVSSDIIYVKDLT